MLNLNKRWTIVLFSSVALNVFLLGVFSVHLSPWARHHRQDQDFAGPPAFGGPMGASEMHGPGPMRGPGGLRGAGGHEIVRDLIRVMGGPTDPRVRDLWHSHRGDHAQMRDRMLSARKAVHAAIAAEPFDKQQLETALAQLQTITNDAQRQAQAGAIELAQKLTPEERARLER